MQPLLGRLDAYLDADDHRIRKTFVTTPAIRRAFSDDVAFVCGRKGTGKSTVAIHLHHDVGSYKSHVPIVENDYLDLHESFVTTLLAGERTAAITPREMARLFEQLWRYILHLAVFNACTTISSKSPTTLDRIDELKQHLHDLGALQSPIKPVLSIARKFLELHAAKPSALLDIADGFGRLHDQRAFRSAATLAESLTQETTVLITIDTLEQYDLSEYRIYPFRGMVRAVKEFLRDRPYHDVAVKCFLPSELVDEIFAENRAKYMDLAVNLEWTYADLLEFTGRRYAYYLQTVTNADARALGEDLEDAIDELKEHETTTNAAWRRAVWARFAPERIKNRIGFEEDAATYFLRHTQRRPRECLCAMNHIIEAAMNFGEFPLLRRRSLINALHSKGNLDTLLNSTLSTYRLPGYHRPLLGLVCRIFANEPLVFGARRLRQVIQRAVGDLPAIRAEAEEQIEHILTRSALLGTVVEQSRRHPEDGFSYHVTRFEYGIPGSVSINEESTCALHPILGDYLNCKDPAGGVVFPLHEFNDWEVSNEAKL